MKDKKFVGLDVHKDTIAIVVINQAGDSLMTVKYNEFIFAADERG